MDGTGSAISARWLIGVLVAILFALASWGISDVRARIEACERHQTEYERTHDAEAREGYQRIARLEERVSFLERELSRR